MKEEVFKRPFRIFILASLLSYLSLPVIYGQDLSWNAHNAHIVINEFDQNPAGDDGGNEWVVLYNPTDEYIDISGWILETTHGDAVVVLIAQGTTVPPKGYWCYTHYTQWLDNEDESIILKDVSGWEIDRTLVADDTDNSNRYWVRYPDGYDTDSDSDWTFNIQTLEKGVIRGGVVKNVVDGDTIDISPVERAGIQRIRLVGIDTPEVGEEGFEQAKDFVKGLCLGKEVDFDVDDEEQYDIYDRILAVIYIDGVNLNAELLNRGYAEILYIPPSEFNPYDWLEKDEIVIDFGDPYGIWIYYNNTTWKKLHSLSPEIIACGDIDGTGKDDIIIDFGSAGGIWVYYNNTMWKKLHPLSPEIIAVNDIDGNGRDDLIIDFGPSYGIWVYYNDSVWSKLHNLSPEIIAGGNIRKWTCMDNFDCGRGEFCEKPVAECEETGVCSPQPDVCVQVWHPVCGCDGVTYSNSACATVAGVSVAYFGPCEE